MRLKFRFSGLGADRSEALNTDRVERAVGVSPMRKGCAG